LRGWTEFKNSSAEADTLTSRPAELIRPSSDSRTEISSSTTATSGAIEVSFEVSNEISIEPSTSLSIAARGGEIYNTLVLGPHVRALLAQSSLRIESEFVTG
jgi:hypothetical protein